MTTPVTPLRQPPAEDLRNAMETAMLYEIEGTLDEKSTALRRVRVLIQSAFDKLSEPFPVVIEATQRILRGNAVELDTRDARDVAQVVTFAALNWREAGDLP